MAYFTKALIRIDKFRFEYYHKIEIESSWAKGDRATILLPKAKKMLEDNLKSGMEVQIWGGYYTENTPLTLLFEGFIKSMSPKIPFEIVCEDRFYKMKREKLPNKSWKSTTLKEVLNYVLSGFKVVYGIVPDIVLSPFKIDNATVAVALQKLCDDYLITSYFRAGIDTLFIGLPYSEEILQDTPIFHFQKNVPFAGNNLVFKTKEDIRIKAKVVNIKPDNTRQEFETGDADGEVRTIYLRSKDSSEKALKILADREVEKQKYDGYRGSLDVFGTPLVIHSQAVIIEDDLYPNRRGKYVCDSVKTVFSVPTLRQTITLGKSL